MQIDNKATQRFWAKVNRRLPGECWEWTASTNDKGYGRMLVDGKVRAAHRVSFAIANKEIPVGALVLHRCDNPPCVNPAHLYSGTHADNASDMARRGRSRWKTDREHMLAATARSTESRTASAPRGEAHFLRKNPERVLRGGSHPNAKLSEDDVRDIRSLVAGGVFHKTVAARFGITRSAVGHIVNRDLWGHIE